MFVDTLTADGKYSLRNRKHLPQPIQLQLSKKQNSFSHFFASYLKFTSNLAHFEKKDDPHRLCILKITDAKDVVS